MKAKKITALLMAAVMTVSLAACGNSGATTAEPAADSSTEAKADTEADTDDADADTEAAAADGESYDELLEEIIPEETVTLDVFDQLANYSGEQIGWFGQIMLEKFNVKLNIIPDPDGVYETRMESGNLGDIVIWGNDSDEYMQYKKECFSTGTRMISFPITARTSKSICPMHWRRTPTFPAELPMATALT